MFLKKITSIFKKKKRKTSLKTAQKRLVQKQKKSVRPVKKIAHKRKPARVSVKKTVSKQSSSQGKSLTKPVKKAFSSKDSVGEVIHYFTNISVAIVKLSVGLRRGTQLYFKGFTTDFKQNVDSMQIDHQPIEEAKKNQEIGIKVRDRVRIGDKVYKV